MNRKQYGISLGLLGVLLIIVLAIGSALFNFWTIAVIALIFVLIAFLLIRRLKEWFDRDERTKMIEAKASHYTLYSFIIMALVAGLISGTVKIEVTLRIAFIGTAIFLQLIRIIFWVYFKMK